MQFLNTLHDHLIDAKAGLAQAQFDHGSPIHLGIRKLSGRGDFRSLTDTERAECKADDDAIIAQHQKSVNVYQAAYDAERARLLGG